jgi:hypothetical protein
MSTSEEWGHNNAMAHASFDGSAIGPASNAPMLRLIKQDGIMTHNS